MNVNFKPLPGMKLCLNEFPAEVEDPFLKILTSAFEREKEDAVVLGIVMVY